MRLDILRLADVHRFLLGGGDDSAGILERDHDGISTGEFDEGFFNGSILWLAFGLLAFIVHTKIVHAVAVLGHGRIGTLPGD